MIDIEEATTVSEEMVAALARLLPELSPSVPAPEAEQIREIVASPCTTLLVARDRAAGARIVGMLTLAVYRTPTSVRAWIEDVVVEPSARGQGVGEALTRRAVELARGRGASNADLTSRPEREAANRLYQRLGFVRRQTNVYRYSL